MTSSARFTLPQSIDIIDMKIKRILINPIYNSVSKNIHTKTRGLSWTAHCMLVFHTLETSEHIDDLLYEIDFPGKEDE
jgi:hypothetical protein